jgi:hypothetical protein
MAVKEGFEDIKSNLKLKTEELFKKNKKRFVKIKDICSSFFENTDETTKRMK